MEKEKNISETCPRALPVVLFKGEQYFADLRLNEFRPVQGFESIPFDSEKGRGYVQKHRRSYLQKLWNECDYSKLL